jgi:hypothetical protein
VRRRCPARAAPAFCERGASVFLTARVAARAAAVILSCHHPSARPSHSVVARAAAAGTPASLGLQEPSFAAPRFVGVVALSRSKAVFSCTPFLRPPRPPSLAAACAAARRGARAPLGARALALEGVPPAHQAALLRPLLQARHGAGTTRAAQCSATQRAGRSAPLTPRPRRTPQLGSDGGVVRRRPRCAGGRLAVSPSPNQAHTVKRRTQPPHIRTHVHVAGTDARRSSAPGGRSLPSVDANELSVSRVNTPGALQSSRNPSQARRGLGPQIGGARGLPGFRAIKPTPRRGAAREPVFKKMGAYRLTKQARGKGATCFKGVADGVVPTGRRKG